MTVQVAQASNNQILKMWKQKNLKAFEPVIHLSTKTQKNS